MKTSDVFGISPSVNSYSYIDRGNLDDEMGRLLSRDSHVAIRGPSKSGKSWLRQQVIPDSIVVQCRLKKPFTEIYVDALSQLDIKLSISENSKGVLKATASATGEVGVSLLAKIGFKTSVGGEYEKGAVTKNVGKDINDLRYIAELIKKSGRRLIIEDFHYMSVDDRTSFAFDMKALWDYGLFIVIIGIWTQTNMLLYLNPDLSGRVNEISIDWSSDELNEVLDKGGAELNLNFIKGPKNLLSESAYSNAGILQQLTLLTLDDAKIYEKKLLKKQELKSVDHVVNACMKYADQLNPVYQEFAKRVSTGIRSRKNATGIYAHAMAVILDATDEMLVHGLSAKEIHEKAQEREKRIQYSNLKVILSKFQELQVDDDGRGLIIGYNPSSEEITVVDRQLLLYRKYATVKWPWEDIIEESEKAGEKYE